MPTKITHRESRRLRVDKLNENLKSISESIPVIEPTYEVVSQLPASIPAGKIVLFNKTLWRGLLPGESSLPAETPWPVKGFKEISLIFSQHGTNFSLSRVNINDYDNATITPQRESTGVYNLHIDIPKHNFYHCNIIANDSGSRGHFTGMNMSGGYPTMVFQLYYRNHSGTATDYATFATPGTVIIREYPPPA
jgi:hypothetical protein